MKMLGLQNDDTCAKGCENNIVEKKCETMDRLAQLDELIAETKGTLRILHTKRRVLLAELGVFDHNGYTPIHYMLPRGRRYTFACNGRAYVPAEYVQNWGVLDTKGVTCRSCKRTLRYRIDTGK